MDRNPDLVNQPDGQPIPLPASNPNPADTVNANANANVKSIAEAGPLFPDGTLGMPSKYSYNCFIIRCLQ